MFANDFASETRDACRIGQPLSNGAGLAMGVFGSVKAGLEGLGKGDVAKIFPREETRSQSDCSTAYDDRSRDRTATITDQTRPYPVPHSHAADILKTIAPFSGRCIRRGRIKPVKFLRIHRT